MTDQRREQAWEAEDRTEEAAMDGSRSDMGTTAPDGLGEAGATVDQDDAQARDEASPVDEVSSGLAKSPPG